MSYASVLVFEATVFISLRYVQFSPYGMSLKTNLHYNKPKLSSFHQRSSFAAGTYESLTDSLYCTNDHICITMRDRGYVMNRIIRLSHTCLQKSPEVTVGKDQINSTYPVTLYVAFFMPANP